jgi:hypothetical protein
MTQISRDKIIEILEHIRNFSSKSSDVSRKGWIKSFLNKLENGLIDKDHLKEKDISTIFVNTIESFLSFISIDANIKSVEDADSNNCQSLLMLFSIIRFIVKNDLIRDNITEYGNILSKLYYMTTLSDINEKLTDGIKKVYVRSACFVCSSFFVICF